MISRVGIIMGSDSDLEIMSEAVKVLIDFEVEYEVKIVSAHNMNTIISFGYSSELFYIPLSRGIISGNL